MCGLEDWPHDSKTDRLFSLEVSLITFKISGHRWQMGPRTEFTLSRSAIKHRYPNDSIVIRGADLWPFRIFFFRLYICFFLVFRTTLLDFLFRPILFRRVATKSSQVSKQRSNNTDVATRDWRVSSFTFSPFVSNSLARILWHWFAVHSWKCWEFTSREDFW